MKKIIKLLLKYITMFLITGLIYYTIEFIWKKIIFKNSNTITNWRMLVLAGILCLVIGTLNNVFTYETDFILQGIIGSLIITLAEAITGYQWNTIEQLNIWDYSKLPCSFIEGNICLEFTIFAWIPLSFVAILIMDYIDWKWFKYMENTPPYYKVFNKKIFQFKNE